MTTLSSTPCTLYKVIVLFKNLIHSKTPRKKNFNLNEEDDIEEEEEEEVLVSKTECWGSTIERLFDSRGASNQYVAVQIDV